MADVSAVMPRVARPADYAIGLPDGWWRIDLDPASRQNNITALVERQFRGRDDAALAKADLANEIDRQARDAWANGGLELFLSIDPLMPASLVVTLIPAPTMADSSSEALSLTSLAASMSDHPGEVAITDLPIGPAVRHRYLAHAEQAATVTSHNLDVFIPVPGADGAFLLLSFSTALEPLADAMIGLFDVIAATLRWIP